MLTMTPQVSSVALNSLAAAVPVIVAWGLENRDRSIDPEQLMDALSRWLESRIEDLASDLLDQSHLGQTWRELQPHLAQSERLALRARLSEDRADYFHLAS
jgi:hypothetical protein